MEHAISILLMHYNFVRVHQSLRVTPAMEARIADHVWTAEEVAVQLEAREPGAVAVAVGAKRKDRRT